MKIIRLVGFALMALLLSAALFTLVAPRFGWRVDNVLSGSMEPKLGIGSVVITRPSPAQDIRIGDIITFQSPINGQLISHRVIAVVGADPQLFRTKGDANQTADPFIVPTSNVVGKVSFHIPCLGYFTRFIKTRWGVLLTLFVPGLIIVASEIRNMWREMSAQESERKRSCIQ